MRGEPQRWRRLPCALELETCPSLENFAICRGGWPHLLWFRAHGAACLRQTCCGLHEFFERTLGGVPNQLIFSLLVGRRDPLLSELGRKAP